MDTRAELTALLAEVRLGAERAEAALHRLELPRHRNVMPPRGMIATLTLASMPAILVRRFASRHGPGKRARPPGTAYARDRVSQTR